MSIDDKKPWERPWTTQEMIDNASNWNLAGDAGLLKYLEEFSDKMLCKAKDTNERLNDLIDSAEETSLALNNATNRFMGLRNTQFIESRVYDDDETLPVKSIEKECDKVKPTEAERLEEMKQAIVKGLDIIDKYYEKVEIPESDSEDDSSEPNIVYKPVDPYCDRPLPYVIGTAEWHKYWHVGLGHSSSDSEIENEEDQFSESESEQDVKVLPNREQTQISDSESEDYSKNKMSRPVANSTFNDQTTKNMFDSSSDSETGSLPPQVNTVNSNFAEELAAKLGKVESSNIEVEVNTKPIKKASASNIPGGLFSDEPPPLDNDDIFVTKNISTDLFSGGSGLFDDDDDFWQTKPKPSHITKPVVDPVRKPVESKDLFAEDDIFDSKPSISETKTDKPVKVKSLGLFDDDDDDSNDIFNTSSSSKLTQNKKPIPILNDEPPELKPDIIAKKLVGGVSILGPNVLLGSKIFQKRAASSSSDSDNDSDKNDTVKSDKNDSVIFDTKSNKDDSGKSNKNDLVKSDKNDSVKSDKIEAKSEPPQKLPSLFDDSSPLFTDDIFASSSIKKFSSKLFEPEDTPNTKEKSDLFRNEPPPLLEKLDSEKPKSEKPKSEKSESEKPKSEKPASKLKSSILFDEETNEDELFSTKHKSDKIPDIGVKTSKKSSASANSLSLFDDNNSDDELFASVSNKNPGHSLFDPNPPELNNHSRGKSVNLFDPNPPELDESDNKSDSQFSDDPAVSYGSMNAGRAFLYDTEPPMLSNESSGIARDQSTRLESEDSSFYPYLTSSRRHSDIFQDTQTADSLLTTRNKISFAADSTTKSNLSGIPEIDSMTKIDITASGNESSLVPSDDSSVFQTNISAETIDRPTIAQKPTSVNKNPEVKPSLFDDPTSKIDIRASGNESLLIPNDDSSVFQTNIFSETTNKPTKAQKPTSVNKNPDVKQSLFDDEDLPNKPIEEKSSLFDDPISKIDITASKNESSLIPKDDNSVFQTNISAETTDKPTIAQKPSINKSPDVKPSLFDDEDSPNKPIDEKSSLFDDPISKSNIPKKPNVLNVENILKTSEKNTDSKRNVFSDSDDDDGLFSNKSTSDIINKNIFEDVKNKENDNMKFNYEQNLKNDEDIKVDPKKSLSFDKNIENEKSGAAAVTTKEEVDGEVQSSGTSPGKLKHNLNINLAALLPGAAPPKRNLEKSVSLDSSESQNQSSTEEQPIVKPVIKSAEIKPTLEKSVSFESPVEHNEILPSAVKERAKIPVKRRPSTRRARQEAIRKSAADLKLEDAIPDFENEDTQNKPENILNNINNNNLAENKPQNIEIVKTEENPRNPLLNPLSPSTDEEDFPAIATAATMPKEKDLSDNFTENSLFGKAPIISPVEVASSTNLTKKSSIEDDLFDILKMPPQNLDLFGAETDLFSPSEAKKPDLFASNIGVSQTKGGDTSIFSSSDSENDLFSTPKSELKKTAANFKPAKETNILSSPDDDLFKPSANVSYDDLFKNEDLFSKKKAPVKAVVKKSLFDDDDDDDIFGGSSSSVPKITGTVTPASSSSIKKPIINKLKKISVDSEDILDPLEALKK